jgi:membrane protease YdiL (CAAX protease family)
MLGLAENLLLARIAVMKQNDLRLRTVILSLIGFILLWTVVTDAWGYSGYLFQSNALWGYYIYGIISRIVWVFPAVFLVALHRDKLAIAPRALLRNAPRSKMFFVVLGISAVYCGIVMVISHEGMWINTKEPLLGIFISILAVGIVEETVFRGWGYNALRAMLPNHKAIIVSTGLFVVLHWPAYFIRMFLSGSFDWAGILGQSSAAIVWGVVLCYLFMKDKSIWSAIISHFFYDFIFILFVG